MKIILRRLNKNPSTLIHPTYNEFDLTDAKFYVKIVVIGKIPHVRVIYEDFAVAYVRLDKAKYYTPRRRSYHNSKHLDMKERIALMRFFCTYGTERVENASGMMVQLTYWDEAVRFWLKHDPRAKKYFKNGTRKVPDYLKLK